MLTFSSSDKRKNISRTINAFLSAEKRLPGNYKLVILGNLPKKDKEFDSIDFNKLADNIILTGPVDDIQDLLCCADCLVFASLYEGFGIPILEAFSCGLPVIASNCSSMPEVAGDAALLVDPYDEKSISEAMVRICSDIQLRNRLIDSGTQRFKQFSWKKTALKTLQVYKKLLE
jgi:glycosyltransferase involved in cell wall biosynthesis